jgi:hypothetical protein
MKTRGQSVQGLWDEHTASRVPARLRKKGCRPHRNRARRQTALPQVRAATASTGRARNASAVGTSVARRVSAVAREITVR